MGRAPLSRAACHIRRRPMQLGADVDDCPNGRDEFLAENGQGIVHARRGGCRVSAERLVFVAEHRARPVRLRRG